MKNTRPSSSLESLGRLSGFLYLALIPLVTLIPVTPVPAWLTEDLILRWVAVFLLLVGSLLYVKRSSFAPTWHLGLADVLVVLLSGWTLFSAHNSQQSFDSFYALKNLLVMTLFWFSLRSIWDNFPVLYGHLKKFFWATSVVAAIWVFVSTMGHLFWFSLFQNVIPRQGFFTNSNIAAGYLGLSLIFALLQMIRKETIHPAAFLIVLLAWGCTQSRGAFLAMLIVVVVYAVLNTREIEKALGSWSSGQWKKFGFIVFLVVIASVPMINRVFHAFEMDPRAYFRVAVWASAWNMAMAQPLFGFGPGTFGDVYPAYRSGALWNTVTPFAHNEYLQVAAECGLPGLILMLLMLWALLSHFRRNFAGVSIFKTIRLEVQAAEIAFYMILFEACHNFVDFTLHDWSHRLVLLGFITFALKKKKEEEDLSVALNLSSRAFAGAGLLLLFAFFWILGVGAFKDYLGQMYNFKSVLCQRTGDLDGAESYANKSIACRPNNMNPWNSLGAVEDVRASLSEIPTQREKHFDQAKKDFDQASSLSPYSMTPQENEVQDLVKRGRYFEAMDMEKKLIERIPEEPSHYLGLGMILIKLHRTQEALAPVQQALDIDDYFVPAQLLKAEILESLGKKEEALKTYLKAESILKDMHMEDPSGQLEPRIQRLQSGR